MRNCGCSSLAGNAVQPDANAAKAALLRTLRDAVQPIIAEISLVAPAKRAEAVESAFKMLGIPESAAAIRRLADKLVQEGVPANAAFREALARVIVTNMLYVMPQQYEVARQRVLARGGNPDQFMPLGNWLGDAYRGVKKNVTTAVKVGARIAKKATDVVESVSCSPIFMGAVSTVGSAAVGAGAASGPALCGAAKAQKFVLDKVNSTVNPKKKKKAASVSTVPVPAPAPASAPMPEPGVARSAPRTVTSHATSSTSSKRSMVSKNNVRSASTSSSGHGGLIVVGLLAAGGLAYVVMRQRKLKLLETGDKHEVLASSKHKLHVKG